MKIIKETIALSELKQMAAEIFGNFVKGVVDVDKGFLAVHAELHSDLEAFLLDEGSKQKDLWGINLYPDAEDKDFIEYDSMINLRPSVGNRSRGVENEATRNKIIEVVSKRVKR